MDAQQQPGPEIERDLLAEALLQCPSLAVLRYYLEAKPNTGVPA